MLLTRSSRRRLRLSDRQHGLTLERPADGLLARPQLEPRGLGLLQQPREQLPPQLQSFSIGLQQRGKLGALVCARIHARGALALHMPVKGTTIDDWRPLRLWSLLADCKVDTRSMLCQHLRHRVNHKRKKHLYNGKLSLQLLPRRGIQSLYS